MKITYTMVIGEYSPSDSEAARRIKWSFGKGMPTKAPAISPRGPYMRL